MLVFDSIEVSPPPPTKRRALAQNNKGTKANPASKPKPNTGKSRPARESAAEGTPEEERMSIALGHPQDSADESDEEQPVKGPGSSARKRSRVSSSSDESHRSATTDTSDGEVRDDLPLPASIAADNKRLKAKRETTLNNAALRSPRKTKTGKVRKVDTKRKLTALSQGVRDRRSEDEESDEEDFVVDDDDAIIYDTTTEEEEDQQPPPTSKKQKKKAAAERKGKERAVTEEEEEAEDRPASKKKERGKGKSRKQVQRDLLATDSEDEQPIRSASKRKHGKKNGGRVVRSDNEDDDEEEDEPVQRKKRRRRQHHRSSGSEEESNSDDGIDDGPEDLKILDEETVLDQKFRTLKTNESKFASLKAARDRESSRALLLLLRFPGHLLILERANVCRSKGESESDRARFGGRKTRDAEPLATSADRFSATLPRRSRPQLGRRRRQRRLGFGRYRVWLGLRLEQFSEEGAVRQRRQHRRLPRRRRREYGEGSGEIPRRPADEESRHALLLQDVHHLARLHDY